MDTRVTREQIAEAIGSIDGYGEPWPHDFMAADAVLDLIDKENTMTDKIDQWGYRSVTGQTDDDTIPVPRALIEAAASGRMTFEQVRDIRALLDPPKPPAPRLRVVDADTMPFEGGVTHWNAWGHNIEAQPDLLTTLDKVIDEWADNWGMTWTSSKPDLEARIRAALTKENS